MLIYRNGDGDDGAGGVLLTLEHDLLSKLGSAWCWKEATELIFTTAIFFFISSMVSYIVFQNEI